MGNAKNIRIKCQNQTILFVFLHRISEAIQVEEQLKTDGLKNVKS